MIKKGQSILEFALIFIIVTALIMGLLALWSWSKNNILARQGEFESTRMQAGSKDHPGEPAAPFVAVPIADGRTYLFK
ncbi:MAG: hypothetical protein NTX01_01070 [Candidatus Omnitrophica bacterium]|nr:hypothetical protein [Candidatus Omnitrophota bacterium]